MIESPIDINKPDANISEWLDVWKRNRDIIEGERVIKSPKNRYLPREAGLDDEQFKNVLVRSPFTPGASRVHEGLMGLVFRKPPVATAPPGMEALLEVISGEGLTIDELSDDVVSELLITNFVGLLTDYPVTPPGMSLKTAFSIGATPKICLFAAESILGIETGRVNYRRRVVRVRLLDDDNTVRELRLDNSVYTVTLHRKVGDKWFADEPITPTRTKRGSKPETLDEIPFSLVTSNRKFQPAKSKLDNVCRINLQHFIASSNLALADYWSSHPIPYLFGTTLDKLDMTPGSWVQSKARAQDVRIGMLEYSGAVIGELRTRVRDEGENMSLYGSRILTPEKDAVQSGHTLSIKAAVDNATLAGTVKLAERWINDQLKWVAWWLGLEENVFSYKFNTDYGLEKLSVEERKQIMDEWVKGVYSKDTLYDQFITGDVLPQNFDRELEEQKIAEEIADRPPVDPIALAPAANNTPNSPNDDEDESV